jgi:hypothetical protein
MSISCFEFQFPDISPCPNVYLVTAYVFFFILILPLSFFQCVTKVGTQSAQNLVPHRVRSLVSYFNFPNNPLPQFHPVAVYVFFLILIFLLFFRPSLTTVWCIPDSKATSLHRSMWPRNLLVRSLSSSCLSLLLRPPVFHYVCCVSSVFSPFTACPPESSTCCLVFKFPE